MKDINEAWHVADDEVLKEIRDFHARQRITSRTAVFATLVSPGYDPEFNATWEFQEFACSPLPIGFRALAPFDPAPGLLRRRGSVRAFDSQAVSYETLSALLGWAKCAVDSGGHRPYPSGGGLYPIETFVVPLRPDGVETLGHAVYRALARSRQLEFVAAVEPSDVLDAISRPPLILRKPPAFALVYAASFERVIPKYRHRGYRTALIEAGAIIQQVDLCAKALGLATVPWAWFDEYELSRLLGLNPVRLPLVLCQLVGFPDSP